MTTEANTQEIGTGGKARRALLLTLALGALLAVLVALLAGTAREAQATFPGTNGKIVFISQRTTGTGVDNPTGDSEIFTIKPDGTGLKQLTVNTADDREPTLSPDGRKIAYASQDPISNPGGDYEVYLMNASDGSDKKNLSNTGLDASDGAPVFSPNGQWIAYESYGIQTSNPEGDQEIYLMNASDGSSQKNLSNNGAGVSDYGPAYSPDGTKIAYESEGIQTSNSQGDQEIYRMSAADGSGKKNLSNNGAGVGDSLPVLSPNGQKIAYLSYGKQTSNSEGDDEVYVMNTLDGLGKKNLSNNAEYDYDPDWGVRAM